MSQGVHCSFPVATRKYASSKKKSTSSKFDSVRLTDYCLRRLQEIRHINEMSRTPSAFSCLMSFIGFLSTLVYGKDGLKEVESYSRFMHDYVKELKCSLVVRKGVCATPRSSGHPANNSWGEVIYSLVRCGLVHNLNVSGKKKSQEQVTIALTHSPLCGCGYGLRKFGRYKKPRLVAHGNESVVLAINAFDLCDAIQCAIIRMFQKPKVRASVKDALAEMPLIRRI